MPRASRRLWGVSLAVAATLPGDALLYAVLPVLWADLGLELWMVGVLLAANRAVRLASNPLAGLLVGRIGIHRPFTAAVFASAAITAGYALTPGFAVFLALRLAWGALWSFLRLGGMLAALAAGEAGQGRALGFYGGVANLGVLVAMALGGVLTDTVGFPATMGLFALLALPAGGAMLRLGPGPEERAARPDAPADPAEPGTPAAAPGALRRWSVYGAALVTGASGTPVAFATLGLLVVERHGPEVSVAGWAVGAATLTGGVLAIRFALQPLWGPLAGHLSDRLGRRRFAALSGGAAVLALAALARPGGLGWTVGTAVAVFLAAVAVRVSCDALAGDAAPPQDRARFLGWYTNAADLGTALAPLWAYPLAEVAGVATALRAAAAGLAVGGVGVWWLLGRAGPDGPGSVRLEHSRISRRRRPPSSPPARP